MWKEFKEKKETPRLVCEGPAEPSDTSSGHTSALKHTTKTTTPTTTPLDFKMMDMLNVNSHKDGG